WVDPWGWACSGKTPGGKGLGGNQKVDRAARELDYAVQRASKYLDRGGHMNTAWERYIKIGQIINIYLSG
ncbi:hypothetical protein ACRU22_18695, partial [Providencia stuartii]